MATYTPPPYFPQGSLAPANRSRYRKFKLMMLALGLLVLMFLAGAVVGVWYLISRIF